MPDFSVLKSHGDHEKALQLLNQTWLKCRLVIDKYQLKVGKVSEFMPTDDRLLGLNINLGQHIKIRLRRKSVRPVAINKSLILNKNGKNMKKKRGNKQINASSSFDPRIVDRTGSEFMPDIDILGTMLHELCHNLHPNHSQSFYSQLDKFWDDIESSPTATFHPVNSNSSSSSAGSTFTGTGHRLSRSNSSNNNGNCRSKAVEAALNRNKYQNLMGQGTYRLSDNANQRNGSAREMAIQAALKRRQDLDAVQCGIIDLSLDSDGEKDKESPVIVEIPDSSSPVKDSTIVLISDDDL